MFYLSYYFINISKLRPGHSVVHFLSRVDASLGWSAYFILYLPERPFSWLVAIRILPPFLSCCFYHGWNLPIVVFVFTGCVITHLGLSENFSNNPLHFWGFYFIVLCPIFLEEAPKLLEKLIIIPAWTGLNFLSNILIGLCSCIQVSVYVWPLFPGVLVVGSFLSLGSISKRVSDIIGGTDLPLWAVSRGVLSLISVFVIPWWRRYRGGFFPSLLR